MDEGLKEIRQKLFDIDMKIQLEHDLEKRNELKKFKKDIYTEYKKSLLKSYVDLRLGDDINDKHKGR